jgi:hypothetical protein
MRLPVMDSLARSSAALVAAVPVGAVATAVPEAGAVPQAESKAERPSKAPQAIRRD